jgi:L,D-transpeptidase ErfK/SrfK
MSPQSLHPSRRRRLGLAVRRLCAVAGPLVFAAVGGCVFMPRGLESGAEPPVVTVPDREAPRLAPLETRHFDLPVASAEVVGETQVIFARYENTFAAIARQYDLGYDELGLANPGVDRWLPGEGTPIYLPTQTILPDAPRVGIVVNVPAMRLYYFEEDRASGAVHVTSHPIGIGTEGWETPTGEAKVTQKARDPVWYVPASVRKEHADHGDILPRLVQPGPDNPLGKFALALSLPGYLIHGTNKPSGVGMRVSHGCIRLYPEDIAELFEQVPKGTPVRLVNQPVVAGWRNGQLYLEVHPPLAEDGRDIAAEVDSVLHRALERASAAGVDVDDARVAQIVAERRGIPFPVLRAARAPEQYLAASRVVENTVPIERAADAGQTPGPALSEAGAGTLAP